MEKKNDEPVMGIPYNPPPQTYTGYQSRHIPPNAVVGYPKGIPIQQTIYRDTPAPINCVFCGSSGLTNVRYFIHSSHFYRDHTLDEFMLFIVELLLD